MIHILLMAKRRKGTTEQWRINATAKRHKDTTVLRQGNEETESLRGWEYE